MTESATTALPVPDTNTSSVCLVTTAEDAWVVELLLGFRRVNAATLATATNNTTTTAMAQPFLRFRAAVIGAASALMSARRVLQ